MQGPAEPRNRVRLSAPAFERIINLIKLFISMNKRPFLVSFLIVLAFTWYYFFDIALHERAGFLTATNAVVAFSAVIILGLAFFLGPLSNILKFFKKYIHDRKEFGLIGYGLASLHLIIAVFLLLESSRLSAHEY